MDITESQNSKNKNLKTQNLENENLETQHLEIQNLKNENTNIISLNNKIELLKHENEKLKMYERYINLQKQYEKTLYQGLMNRLNNFSNDNFDLILIKNTKFNQFISILLTNKFDLIYDSIIEDIKNDINLKNQFKIILFQNLINHNKYDYFNNKIIEHELFKFSINELIVINNKFKEFIFEAYPDKFIIKNDKNNEDKNNEDKNNEDKNNEDKNNEDKNNEDKNNEDKNNELKYNDKNENELKDINQLLDVDLELLYFNEITTDNLVNRLFNTCRIILCNHIPNDEKFNDMIWALYNDDIKFLYLKDNYYIYNHYNYNYTKDIINILQKLTNKSRHELIIIYIYVRKEMIKCDEDKNYFEHFNNIELYINSD